MNSTGPASPTVYVFAGPNGAGKSTFATRFLPDFVQCREFLNADLIAAGLSPFAPETQNIRAGRLMLDRIEELSSRKENFSFETTLSGRGYIRLLNRLKSAGYRVYLFFLWLPSDDVALSRVSIRVQQGGHSIPEPDVRRRFELGLKNFFCLYRPIADEWWLYDGSRVSPMVVASGTNEQVDVLMPQLYDQIRSSVEDHS